MLNFHHVAGFPRSQHILQIMCCDLGKPATWWKFNILSFYKLYQNNWYWDIIEFSGFFFVWFFFQYVMNQFMGHLCVCVCVCVCVQEYHRNLKMGIIHKITHADHL